MRRVLLAAVAVATVAIPTTVAVAGITTPAWASSSVTCKVVKGSVSSNTITFSKCSPKSKTNKSASAAASSLQGEAGGTLTWTKSAQTTVIQVSTTSPGQGGCPKGSTEYDATGSVTGGTSTYTHVGDAVSSRLCLSAKFTFTLVKKTTAEL
jgi:hypothetical protein